MLIASDIPKIIAGSAMSAFGFRLGSDMYGKAKKVAGHVWLLMVFMFLFFLTRQSMVWIFRNYRSTDEAISKRFFSIIVYLVSFVISFAVIAFTSDVFIIDYFPKDENIHVVKIYSVIYLILIKMLLAIEFAFSVDLLDAGGFKDGLLSISYRSKMVWVFSSSCVLFITLSGIYTGLAQRKTRKRAWDIEGYNRIFLAENGIMETSEGQFQDADGNAYRLEAIRATSIELFAIGRRNKRGYISFDQDGKFLSWTGLIVKR